MSRGGLQWSPKREILTGDSIIVQNSKFSPIVARPPRYRRPWWGHKHRLGDSAPHPLKLGSRWGGRGSWSETRAAAWRKWSQWSERGSGGHAGRDGNPSAAAEELVPLASNPAGGVAVVAGRWLAFSWGDGSVSHKKTCKVVWRYPSVKVCRNLKYTHFIIFSFKSVRFW